MYITYSKQSAPSTITVWFCFAIRNHVNHYQLNYNVFRPHDGMELSKTRLPGNGVVREELYFHSFHLGIIHTRNVYNIECLTQLPKEGMRFPMD